MKMKVRLSIGKKTTLHDQPKPETNRRVIERARNDSATAPWLVVLLIELERLEKRAIVVAAPMLAPGRNVKVLKERERALLVIFVPVIKKST